MLRRMDGRAVAALRDRDALERFVAATYPDVWRLCAVLVDAQSAGDLAQETFLRATRARGRFRGDANPRTWVLAIARATCIDELRARYRRARRDDLLTSAHGGERATHDHAEDVAAYDLIRQLEPDRRAAFVLTQMLRLTYADAARVCGCPQGTIRSRVARAREDLIAAGVVARPAGGHQSTAPAGRR